MNRLARSLAMLTCGCVMRRGGGMGMRTAGWLALVLLIPGRGPAIAQQVVTAADRIRVLSGDVQRASQTLEAERPKVISDSIVMNTVRQYPKRRELDGYLEQRSAEARAWESKLAAGEARRTRVLNPYDGSTYTRYYDADGNWQYSVIENDYRATEKLQAEWNAKFQRARATLDELRRDYDAVVAGGGLTAAERSELDGMLATASERVGQFGSPPPELLPRPVEGEDNSPFPTYKAFDAFTGKVIHMGRTGSNPRPIADDAPTAAGGSSTGGGTPRPPAAPFRLYGAQNSGSYQCEGTFDSFEAAKVAGQRWVSSSSQQRFYAITDSRDPGTQRKLGKLSSGGNSWDYVVFDSARGGPPRK